MRAFARRFEPGRQSVDWDRRSDAGARVAPGVYLIRMTVAGHRETRSVVLLN